MLAIGFSYVAFTMLRYIPSIPSFLRAFIMKWCWILSKDFSASIQRIMWVLYLLLFICCIAFMNLLMLNNPCIPEMKPTWSWYMIFFMCCWIIFVRTYLRMFVFVFIKLIGLNFLLCPYHVLILRWNWLHRMSLVEFLLFLRQQKLRSIGVRLLSTSCRMWECIQLVLFISSLAGSLLLLQSHYLLYF
jgi:hypothetical protein